MTANKGGLARPSPRRHAPRRPPEPGWVQPRCHAVRSMSPGGERGPVPSKATAAHGLCPRADGTSGPLHLHPRPRGSRDAQYSAPAAWAQRRAALLRESQRALHSFGDLRSTLPTVLLLTGGFPAAAGKPGSSGGPGDGGRPSRTCAAAGCRRAPKGPAVPLKGRADVRGSSVPLLNPPCNFKSTANKAQSL